jgi:hypothetical protein
VELGISFYPDDENQPPKVVKVIMPEGWTLKIYLAALNKSVRRHSILSYSIQVAPAGTISIGMAPALQLEMEPMMGGYARPISCKTL